MAYIEYNRIQEFPYNCQFFRTAVNENLPLDQQEVEKVMVFNTICDITEASHSWSNNAISAKYAVFFPYEAKTEVLVQNGDLFEANMGGVKIHGTVVGVFTSQLGGVSVYIQDTNG